VDAGCSVELAVLELLVVVAESFASASVDELLAQDAKPTEAIARTPMNDALIILLLE
jgi:hypothetical protein